MQGTLLHLSARGELARPVELPGMVEKHPRLAGLGVALLGLGLGKFSLYDVLAAARAGAASVNYSVKMVVLSLALVELGGLMMLLGPTYLRLFHRPDDTRRLSPLGFVLVVVIIVPAFGGYAWLESTLAQLGYKS